MRRADWRSPVAPRHRIRIAQKEAIDNLGQFIRVRNLHLHEDVLFPRHPMTLHHLRSPLGQLDNRTDLARSWSNADVSAQRATEGGGAHVQPIASDHPGSPQTLKAICHGWPRQLDTPRELSDR
jgi:hypothetical protein